eukprot:scaffold233712_cov21-Tisochrysis_lutea.AAC.1
MHPSMTPAHPSMTPAAAPYTPMHAPTPTPGDDNDFMLGGASDYQVREGGVATCSWAQIDPHGQTCQCQSGSEKASQVGHMGWSLNAGWVMEPQIRVVQGESSHVGRRTRSHPGADRVHRGTLGSDLASSSKICVSVRSQPPAPGAPPRA